ncbi:MAG: hypothetical protein ABIS47_13010 [Acidimicrobiales bacterium]
MRVRFLGKGGSGKSTLAGRWRIELPEAAGGHAVWAAASSTWPPRRAWPAGSSFANRIAGADHLEAIRTFLGVDPDVVIPDDASVRGADREGISPIDHDPGSPAMAPFAIWRRRSSPEPGG